MWQKWKLFQTINQDPLDKSVTSHCNIRKNVNLKNAGWGVVSTAGSGLVYTIFLAGREGVNPGAPAVEHCDFNEACVSRDQWISENMGRWSWSSEIPRLWPRSNVTRSHPIGDVILDESPASPFLHQSLTSASNVQHIVRLCHVEDVNCLLI